MNKNIFKEYRVDDILGKVIKIKNVKMKLSKNEKLDCLIVERRDNTFIKTEENVINSKTLTVEYNDKNKVATLTFKDNCGGINKMYNLLVG